MFFRLFLCFCTFSCWINATAQTTTLKAGDIAIIGFQTDNSDQFAFVTLVDIAANTKIQFSEKGWNGALAIPVFATSSESVHTWTAPNSGILKGTTVTVEFSSTGTNPVASLGTISSTSVSGFSTAGDQLIAFQGTESAPIFIYALSSNTWLTKGSPTTTQSWLPLGLTNGISAKDFSVETDDQYFNITNLNAIKNDILTAIGNTINWTRSNTRFTNLPNWNFSVSLPYYSKSTGTITDLNTWGNEKDGTGNSPNSFEEPGYTYVLSNRNGLQNLTANFILSKLSIDSGIVLGINGNTLSVANFATGGLGKLAGSNTSLLNITGDAGTVKFDSSTAILKNLSLFKKAVLTLANALQIKAGIDPGNVLLGDSSLLISNGNLVLSADNNGTARLDKLGNGAAIIGKVVVQQYIPGGKRSFRFLAHPFTKSIGLIDLTNSIDITGQSGLVNGFTNTATNNPSSFWYNPLLGDGTSNDQGWIPFTNTNGIGNNAWNPMQGIRVLIRGKIGEGLTAVSYTPSPITINLSGELNTGNQKVYLSKSITNVGFNLIGNPYASNIDMHQLIIGNNVATNYFIWNPQQGTKGGYSSYPFSNSVCLPAFAAFFVQTTDTSSENFIQFTENAKANTNATTTVFGGTQTNSNQLELSIESDGIFWDKHLLVLDPSSNNGVDKYDAIKINNPELDFYSISNNGEKLSIDTRPNYKDSIIPLGIETALEGNFHLRAIQTPKIAGTELSFHDKYTNKIVPIGVGFNYDFIISKETQTKGINRFEIILKPLSNNLIAENNRSNEVQLYPNPFYDWLTIKWFAKSLAPSFIQIHKSNGQLVFTGRTINTNDLQVSFSLKKLPAGIYYVSLFNTIGKSVHKIIKL
jgi:Secretion system C-terminal sorting domain